MAKDEKAPVGKGDPEELLTRPATQDELDKLHHPMHREVAVLKDIQIVSITKDRVARKTKVIVRGPRAALETLAGLPKGA